MTQPLVAGKTLDQPFLRDVFLELETAVRNHAPMNSAHEAYSVLLEEVEEFWDEVRKKREQRDLVNMRRELVQIATMAWRACRDLGLE